MQQLIKINHLGGWATPVQHILKGIADFNATGIGCIIDSHEDYIKRYNRWVPGMGYSTRRENDTLEIFADDELLLSITMYEVHELEGQEQLLKHI